MDSKKFFRLYVDDLYTLKDIHGLKDELSKPETVDDFSTVSEEVWKEAQEVNSELADAQYDNYKREAHDLLLRITGKTSRKRRSFGSLPYIRVGMVAAVFVVTIIGAMLIEKHDSNNFVTEALVTLTTGVGERRDVILPDGTKLTLNSCSKLTYPENFDLHTREIELAGEAFLNVARRENQPFIVNTQNIRVQVLGTCFNVKTYSHDNNASVYVKSGKVKVSIPNADVYLEKTEGLSLNLATGNFSKYQQTVDESAWRSGVLQFANTPLKDVLNEVERLYGCTLKYDEALIDQYTVTGELENMSLKSVVESLSYITLLKYKFAGDNLIEIYQ